ncbi:hypothetical protein AK830_g5149 [Neonectria ditissima]|uniref:Dienelactone hydrolase domain-containing protein n=1 Tax=Neonectria ditissima TaxID=78410 RepID=A0A0P7B527_9HYPO|nr:hypothetical protein AK830_g5149 [Neonectria ditissima]
MHFTRALVGFYSIFAVATAYDQLDSGIIKHEGEAIGKEIEYDGVTLYISKPKQRIKRDTAVLYLTDVFGIPLLQNKLLADSFSRAGFVTITPDILNGDPAPHDIDFDAAEYLSRHTPENTDPIIEKTIDYIHNELKIKKIAVTGYCFGGRYAFRFLAEGKGADVGFAAHPSLLQDSEILAIDGPASIAAAEVDTLLNATRRSEIEGLLGETPQAFQVNLYSGTSHGFGVRANVSDPEQKFGKEEAFWQAVKWFNSW